MGRGKEYRRAGSKMTGKKQITAEDGKKEREEEQVTVCSN